MTSGGSFLNPYHFIPLAEPPEGSRVEAAPYLAAGVHHRFAGYSGRIVCRLTTEGPVVIGGEQRSASGDPAREREVDPFELPAQGSPAGSPGRPAVPGSTLRGLISSLVEAASCSAMRVLPNKTYTRRAEISGESQSAVGMIKLQNGRRRVLPLTLSLKEMSRPGAPPRRDRCRAFLDAYRRPRGARRTEPAPDSFLAKGQPKSWSASHREFWYANLEEAHWDRRGPYCLGLRFPPAGPKASGPLLSQKQWADLAAKPGEQRKYKRGILLILGLGGSKAANLPPTKKHEYFIPYPPERDRESTFEIPPAVLREFENLAQDAHDLPRGGSDEDFPFLHEGRARQNGDWTPRDGDLVYFEADRATKKVTRIAYSAIWRRPIEGNLHQAVAQVSPDLVPLHPGRTHLTLAERLFGFVELDPAEQRADQRRPAPGGRKPPIRALAGRVRFAHGLAEGAAPQGGWYEEPVLLKILASPKPPSPALYFGNNGYLAKRKLNLGLHPPQGRKVYLHHPTEDVAKKRYETRDLDPDKLKLKARVRPLKTGTSFLFHVDFTNLSRQELGFLLYGLRPMPEFRHKLGMGKPLGLGRARIDVLALAFIDRRACYQAAALFGPKFSSCEARLAADGWSFAPAELGERYRHEREAARGGAPRSQDFPTIDELATEARARVPAEVRGPLELVGDPSKVKAQVTYPLTTGQDGESEHFQWFVANDRDQKLGGKPLRRLEAGSKALPSLERLPPYKPS